jgi:chemotaxis regulatin CheY-phosphate phosphatase CheZ
MCVQGQDFYDTSSAESCGIHCLKSNKHEKMDAAKDRLREHYETFLRDRLYPVEEKLREIIEVAISSATEVWFEDHFEELFSDITQTKLGQAPKAILNRAVEEQGFDDTTGKTVYETFDMIYEVKKNLMEEIMAFIVSKNEPNM